MGTNRTHDSVKNNINTNNHNQHRKPSGTRAARDGSPLAAVLVARRGSRGMGAGLTRG
jgi:hypothetical protein